jgi:hypothetical protein
VRDLNEFHYSATEKARDRRRCEVSGDGDNGPIQNCAPWIPPILSARQDPPECGPVWERYSTTLYEKAKFGRTTGTTIKWSQYWHRALVDQVDCGQVEDLDQGIEYGISEEQATELDGTIGIGIAKLGLNASVGSKLTNTVTRHSTTTLAKHVKGVKAPACERVTVVFWQCIDIIDIKRERLSSRGGEPHIESHKTYSIPQSNLKTRVGTFHEAECCPGDEVPPGAIDFATLFPTGIDVRPGVFDQRGRVNLLGVKGSYTVGTAVPLDAFPADRGFLSVPKGIDLTFGLLTPAREVAVLPDPALDERVDGLILDAPQQVVRRVFRGRDLLKVNGILGQIRSTSSQKVDPLTYSSLANQFVALALGASSHPVETVGARHPARRPRLGGTTSAPARATTAKKAAAARNTTVKKAAARKSTAKKAAAARKTTVKKAAARESTAKKAAARRSPARRSAGGRR